MDLGLLRKGASMKVVVNVECSPEEARKFLGLPDIAPMQDKMMKEIEARMQDNIRNLDPETLVRTWLPATLQGWAEMQKLFWSQMGMAGPNTAPGSTPPDDRKPPSGRSRPGS
jgi:hypothetical protein